MRGRFFSARAIDRGQGGRGAWECVGVACAFVQVSMSTMTKQRVCEREFGKEKERRRDLRKSTKVRNVKKKRAMEDKNGKEEEGQKEGKNERLKRRNRYQKQVTGGGSSDVDQAKPKRNRRSQWRGGRGEEKRRDDGQIAREGATEKGKDRGRKKKSAKSTAAMAWRTSILKSRLLWEIRTTVAARGVGVKQGLTTEGVDEG